jgi:hypothetical protein
MVRWQKGMLDSFLCTRMHPSRQDLHIQRDRIPSLSVYDQAHFSAVHVFDYNHQNDLQSLQMAQGITELSGALNVKW